MDRRTTTDAARRNFLDAAPGWALRPGVPKVAVPVLIAIFWIVDAAVDRFVFREGTSFMSELLSPESHELWTRSASAFFFLVLGVGWYLVATERGRRLDGMNAYQSRLQEMAGRLAYAETEERRELARRLHEDIGQQVTAARMFAETCECDSAGEPADSVSRILGRTVVEIRELSEELAPPALEEYGLSAALESLAQRVSRRSGVTVELASGGTGELPHHGAARVLFQVLTEVVATVATMADVTRVTIELSQPADGLTVTVSWDGRLEGDFFWASERVASIGGRTSIVSDADGSVFVVTFDSR